MEFKLKEIKDKNTWEDFLSLVEEKSFLQSWNWGVFNEKTGNDILRYGIYQEEELVSTVFVLKVKARRGSFIFLPHGPNLKRTDVLFKKEIISFLLKELKRIAKKENYVSIKIAPLWERTKENTSIFKELGFREAPIHIHPDVTWELDLSPNKEDLLLNMRKTTRYLVRKAEKNNDIQIVKSKNIKDVSEFNKIYQITKSRQEFTPFSLSYLENQFNSFAGDNQILILLAKYKEEIIASGIFMFWSDVGFYHHGASSLKYPKIPASYLLMWRAIEEAKERGCKKFNFWGTAPISETGEYNKKHPWAGLTLFKMGFGGHSKKYVKTQDFVTSSKYWPSFILEKMRKIKRGL